MNFKKGIFVPKNKEKYFHSNTKMSENTLYPTYRSSWELKFFKFCDENPNVIQWTSEPFAISYFNPIKNKKANYYPDALINYNGQMLLIEIKPKSQILETVGKSNYDKLSSIINKLKWNAAKAFCEEKKYKFVILTDNFFKKFKNF